MITSAEEAVGMQKKRSALNRFFEALSHSSKSSTASSIGNENGKRQRDVTANIVVISCSSFDLWYGQRLLNPFIFI